ncbi:MAG: hypothetical protein JO303_00380 [Caulobacteraceae bacterium]|nr:hypothetical protein [Caulobacteraceae bacterium]
MAGLNMFPWLLKMPASGDVWQKVTNVTDWFSPRLEMNFAGDPQIEQQVNEHVASYGAQLGLLTEAVLGLADSKHDARFHEAVKRLKDIQAKVEKLKADRPAPAKSALQAMEELRRTDGKAYDEVLEKLGVKAAAS